MNDMATKTKLKYKEHYKDNDPFFITIVDMNYETRTHDEYGTSYEFKIKHEHADVWYVSKAVLDTLLAAKVQSGQEITMEFCNVDFDGTWRKFWKLNGLTKNQWINQSGIEAGQKLEEAKLEQQLKNDAAPAKKPEMESEYLLDKITAIEKRLDALEGKTSNNTGDMGDLPF
tara:strand:- start:9245 stop:9760 length:516 start_codon:yes stop_codon:yes gene_type:complete